MKRGFFSSRVGAYTIKSVSEITLEQKRALVAEFSRDLTDKNSYAETSLGGRGAAFARNISGWGQVVIKGYRRGGLYGKINSRNYLRWGATRGEKEFEILRKVRNLGVRAPEPLAFAYYNYFFCGSLFYRAWLITREVTNSVTLSALSVNDSSKAFKLTHDLAVPLNLLITHKIFHVDLHPGNVLVNERDELILLDFDKAEYFKGSVDELRRYYLRRWRRAVIKHGLPEALSEIMCLVLLSGIVRS
jgi:tRNA A-37 threonylcarbamoyl transferase component Bud32